MDNDDLSIGEAIDLLRDEFPDVSVSKLRFLESQGLIKPARSDGGYRQFGRDDLKRIRYILVQQRDHFLPLKVIKSKLTLWERGEDVEDIDLPDDGEEDPLEIEGEPVVRSDLLRISGLSDDQLDDLISHGLISPDNDSTVFPPGATQIATECRRLIDLGLEPRHLRAVRLSVEREAELIRQLTAPLLRATNVDARGQARGVISSAADSIQALHHSILSSALRALMD
ncbi:MAG: MerR family DNA-binding transcriptional regulator [Acidimicrobiia bacterium]|nr:MerR family DNA-binding transcriptional regulator [Acidimicrobiia bacterium]